MKKNKKQPSLCFSQYYERSKLKRDIRNNGLLLCFVCLSFGVFFFVQAVCSTGVKELLFLLLTAVSVLILLLFWLFPSVLFGWLSRTQSATNRIGRLLITVILVPVYLLLCLVSLPFLRKYRKRNTYKWSDEKPAGDTFFLNDDKDAFRDGSSGILDFLIELISVITGNRNYFLFPILVVLLFLGLCFYFVSSSAVLGFIYTIF